MDGTADAPYALDYSESMAFFSNAYNPANPQAITATEFDVAQELLWAGTHEVRRTNERTSDESLSSRVESLRSTVVN